MLFTDKDLVALFPNFDDRTGAYERTASTMSNVLAIATGSTSFMDFGPDSSLQEAVEMWEGRSIDAVPLEISALPTHFNGEPPVTDVTIPPKNCNVSWSRKVPRVVFDRILADKDFLNDMQQLIWESWKSELLLAMRPFDRCSNCATNAATGFVCSMKIEKGPEEGDKLCVAIIPAFPVCNDLICNARLHDLRGTLLPKNMTLDNQVEACRVCAKIGFGESIKICGRCKTAFYCSRECQLSDWPLHKVSCHKFTKSDRSFP